MPREKQKRGRRAQADQNKRKHEEEPLESNSKRHKTTDSHEHAFSTTSYKQAEAEMGDDYIPLEEPAAVTDNTPFYGLLDSDEQEYFSRANQTLELNQFESDEDRRLFIDSVYEEADHKELKLACSQSCSRFMERLISMSSTSQIKRLFEKFCGNFLHLSQHRFASHCCECLFLRAAPVVTYEMSKKPKGRHDRDEAGESESTAPMAGFFLKAISELEGNWGYLLTEPFASHTIRVLLLVLVGEPFDSQANSLVLASRKKSNLNSVRAIAQIEPSLSEKREVPQSFKTAFEKMVKDLVAGLDGTYLRALATHPVGSPVLQVLLSVELTYMGKARAKEPDSLLRRLVPDDTLENYDSSTFLSGLLFDPVGSRLLETVVRCAPGKFFKIFYQNIIRERIGSLSRNETAAYVVVRCLERSSKEDLENAAELILPEIQALVDRSRFIVIKMLVERSKVRGADTSCIAEALSTAFGNSPAARLNNMLKLDDEDQPEPDGKPSGKSGPSPQQTHGSLLGQAMLQVPGPLAELVQSSLLAISPSTLLQIAKNPTTSRVLQESLVLSKSTAQFRRQATSKFSGHMCELALDASGSHVADALWDATTDLFFVKQRLAEELFENESTLRDSFFGRAVWRNWSMDIYKRRPASWTSKAKGLDNAQSTTDDETQPDRPKSKLDLARARFAANAEQQARSKERRSKGGTGDSRFSGPSKPRP